MRYSIIADDLTGAMDTGMELLQKSKSIRVCINKKYLKKIFKDSDLIIFDTETRNLDKNPASRELRLWMDLLKKKNIKLAYKKIDSTLRGNLGIELEAILDGSGVEMIFFAPALPFYGRTTNKGHHYINGRKINHAEISRDPLSPVFSSYIPELLDLGKDIKDCLVGLSALRGNRKKLALKIKGLYKKGHKIIIFDSETEKDLEKIAALIQDIGLYILPCGSAGLFKYITRSLTFKKSNNGPDDLDKREKSFQLKGINAGKKKGSVIIVSGSLASTSNNQVKHALGKLKNTEYIKLKQFNLCRSWISRKSEIGKAYIKAKKIISEKGNIVIGLGLESNIDMPANKRETLNNSKAILASISLLMRKIITNPGIKGLVLVGGDTAVRICRDLDAYAIEIRGKVQQNIPRGVLVGGKRKGLPVITKSGNLGSKDAITSSIRHILALENNL